MLIGLPAILLIILLIVIVQRGSWTVQDPLNLIATILVVWLVWSLLTGGGVRL